MTQVLVQYVNGGSGSAPASRWRMLPRDGVDYVDLGSFRIQGHSIYWLRNEDGLWHCGGGTITDVNEVVQLTDDEYDYRSLDYMPDLSHSEVKLGWWE